MAVTGTGLPSPQDAPVLAQAPAPLAHMDAFSSADAWNTIANAGAKLQQAGEHVTDTSLNLLDKEMHLRQAGAVADFETSHADWYTKARDQYHGDPGGFENAARAHNDGALSETPEWMVPHAKTYLGGKLESGLSQQLTVKRNKDDHNATVALDSRLKMADIDAQELASSGRLGQPEGRAAVDVYNGVLDTAVQTGAIPQEKADLLRDDMTLRLQGNAIRNGLEDVYSKRGFEGARDWLKSSVKDLGAQFKFADKLEKSGLAWLRSEESGMRGERDAISREWATAKPQASTLPPEVLADIQQRAYNVGALKVADDISQNMSALSVTKLIRGLPVSDQLSILRTGNVSASLAQRESGGDPSKVNQLGFVGLYQFGAPRLADLGVYTPGPTENLGGWNKTPGNAPGKWTGTFNIPGFPDVKTLPDFLANPDAQKAAFSLHQTKMDKEIGALGLDKYVGQTVAGVPITQDGLRSMIHLAGAGGAQAFLVSGGTDNRPDANGTRVSDYARLGSSGVGSGNFEAAKSELNLTPQEQNLYLTHLRNLVGPGGVDNPNGSRSTLFQMSFEQDGKTYNIPTVWDGKILKPQDAIKRAEQEGLDKFPSYGSEAEAEARYQKMHDFMEKDTAAYFKQRSTGSGSGDITQGRSGLIALGMVKKDLAKDLSGKIDRLNTSVNKLEFPALDEVTSLGAQADLVGTEEQRRKVAEIGAMAEYGQKFSQLSAPKRAEVISAWDTKLKGSGTDFERHLRDTLTTADTKISEQFKKDPYGAAYRYSTGYDSLPSIDFSSKDAPGILLAKVQQQNQIRADQGTGAFSALRPDETASLSVLLTKGDPQAASNALQMLSSLPPDIYKATVADPQIKGALDGMVRSYDPMRLNLAMSTLDRQWRDDPIGFSQTFGDETVRRLQTWQAHKDALPADQMAELFKRADDPALHSARKKLEEDADKKLKSITSANVANYMGSFADRNVPFVNNAPPTDSLQGARLVAEYDKLFKERYVDTGDADKAKTQAVERLKTVWGTSSVGGGMMRYPPDRYYPDVGGSKDWMSKDLERAIEGIMLTPRYAMVQTGLEGTTVTGQQNWSYKLMTDPQTEADISAKQSPSYVVAITDAKTGKDNIPIGSDGLPMRFRFDPSAAQDEARAKFDTAHRTSVGQQNAADANLAPDRTPQRLSPM